MQSGKEKIQISIIVVNYHVKRELFTCLSSIFEFSPRVSFEVIVVDNDERKKIKVELHRKFPKVKYLPNKNRGYGQGNNAGASIAKGKYLFILNPDTKIYPECIDFLYDYLEKHKKTAVAAPFLYESNEKIVALQGAKTLTPFYAIFSFSLIHKFFPNNPITRRYWQFDRWNGKSVKEVESVPGAAFMVRKEIFDKIGGFDERFFLYFEENDLSKRIKDKGWKLVMLPKAKVFHSLGNSTKKSKKSISNIFKQSRYYYLKKHFGFFIALCTEGILRVNKYNLILLIVVITGFFLRLHTISDTMPFIGDQGWFYVSAKDMLITGNIPLVGIESSRPWIHQGAMWTYLLALWFWLFSFNPVSPAYLTGILDLLTIILLYKLCSYLFSQKTGIFAAAMYATSPIAIMNSRIPYHTSPIPLLTVLYLFSLFQWMKGRIYYFPLLIFLLALLYNFELVAFLFSIFTGLVILFGLHKKLQWVKNIFSIKIFFLSAMSFIAGMLPMLIYDFSHGFSQTFKFLIWIVYRIFVFFGYPPINPTLPISFNDTLSFFGWYYQKLFFLPNELIAALVFFVSFIYLGFQVLIKKGTTKNLLVIYIFTIFLTGTLFATKMLSEAYLPILVPSTLILTAIFFERIMSTRYRTFIATTIFLVLIIGNVTYLIRHNYSFVAIPNALPIRLELAKQIVKQSEGKEYNLITEGKDKSLPNFSKNYEYLTWWLGHPPSNQKQSLLFIVEEKSNIIKLRKEIKK